MPYRKGSFESYTDKSLKKKRRKAERKNKKVSRKVKKQGILKDLS